MGAPHLSIIDSRDDAKIVYVIVDNCKTVVAKAKIKDVCYVLTLVDRTCHLNLDLKECYPDGE